MSKIGIAFLLMAPCLFAQGAEEHKDEKHKGNRGVHHEEAKPESGPIVHNYILGWRGVTLRNGEIGDYVFGSANVTVNPDGSWSFSGEQ